MIEEVFVAREKELQQLQDALHTALSETGQIRFIVGQAGTGKTALFRHFMQQALEANPELVVLFGTCNAQTGVGDPYLPFREALTMLTTGDSTTKLDEAAPDLVGVFVPGASLLGTLGRAVATKTGWMDRLDDLPDNRQVPAAEQGRIFEQSLEIARRQQARSFELRTLLDLTRLRQVQGDQKKFEEVRAALAETFGWFTEGFDTPDLREARQFLDKLAAPV